MLDKFLNKMRYFLRGSVALVVLFPLAALGVKWGIWHYRSAFSFLVGLTITGAAMFAIVGVGLVTSTNRGNQKAKHTATAAVLILLLPLAYMFSSVYKAKLLPVIHDIATDTSDPPVFVQAHKIRGGAENGLVWNPETIPLQAKAYPDIKSILLPMPMADALKLAEKGAIKLSWEITYKNPQEGIIEATSTSFWFGFVDDIAIRIKSDGETSRIDLRSVSRVGKSDLGVNAQRIRFFRQVLQDMVGR